VVGQYRLVSHALLLNAHTIKLAQTLKEDWVVLQQSI
jgi:hypothetical protein